MNTTHPGWSVRITYTGPADSTSDQLAEHAGALLEALAADAATHTAGVITISLTVDAPTIDQAIVVTDHKIRGAAPAGWDLAGVEVLRHDLLEAELEQPLYPALVGITEAAGMLGVSRQRAHAIAQGSNFPTPIAELASGPVYLASAVEAFAAHPRTAGRPRTVTA